MMHPKINVGESVSIAMSSLFHNKLRSFLTLLGIIIGVTTVITVVTIIQGLDRYVKTQLFAFGSNSFTVSRVPDIITNLPQAQEMFKRRRIEYDDYLYLKNNLPQALLVEAQYRRSAQVKFESHLLKDVIVTGETYSNHLTGRKMELDLGRFLSHVDELYSAQVCVIGEDVRKELFPYKNPLGQWIQIGGQKYRVIGVVRPMGKIMGFSLDAFASIPITTFRKFYPVTRRDITINIMAASPPEIADLKERARTVLRSRRHLSFHQEDDFAIEDSQTFIDMYNNLTRSLYLAMIALSSISMLVGGIVIMNIMLVSVTERIREIGLRKAVGARRRDILIQFLIESSSISAVGGVIGILLGFLFAKLISAATSLPAALEPWSVVAALALSSSVGLFFGIFPANRAARLDPVMALRED